MNPEAELLRAYREWHRLAQAETKAIESRNWSLLNDCHLAIRDYQSLVGRLTQETRTEWRRAGCNLAEKERNLQVMVFSLLDLTRRNHGRLQSTIASAREQLGQLGEAGQNLRRLQRSYGMVAAANRRN